MTEEEAHAYIASVFGIAVLDRLRDFVGIINQEAHRQNLVAATTIDRMWSRHILDSAQLVELAEDQRGCWIDIGSGGGFPGIVTAIITRQPTLLVEPRRLRAEFLTRAVDSLDLPAVKVLPSKIETVEAPPAAVITARAVAPMTKLFALASHLSDQSTRWLLPKGASAAQEVAATQRDWRGTFHVKQSLTEPAAGIVIAQRVARR